MKKIAIFFLILVIIVVLMFYMFINYQNKESEAKKENQYYESLLDKEINGLEIATILNKTIDKNNINEVSKDDKGYYIENDDSIKIDIKFIDNDKTYSMENLYSGGIEQFTSYYGKIKFKCTKIEYHEENKKVKYLLFEQVTIY